MATPDNPPTYIAEQMLAAFELPKWLVEPAVRSCRLFNTTLDFIFYDVPTLRAALVEKDAPLQARGKKPPMGTWREWERGGVDDWSPASDVADYKGLPVM